MKIKNFTYIYILNFNIAYLAYIETFMLFSYNKEFFYLKKKQKKY